MSTTHTYSKAKFSQVNLDDKTKLLISYGATDIRVFELGFLGTPKNTMHIFSNIFLSNLNAKIGYDMTKDIVKILADEIVKARSKQEAKQICSELEENKDFIESI